MFETKVSRKEACGNYRPFFFLSHREYPKSRTLFKCFKSFIHFRVRKKDIIIVFFLQNFYQYRTANIGLSLASYKSCIDTRSLLRVFHICFILSISSDNVYNLVPNFLFCSFVVVRFHIIETNRTFPKHL